MMRLMRVQVGLKLTADVCTNKCHHCMKRIDHNSWLTIPGECDIFASVPYIKIRLCRTTKSFFRY